MFRQRVPELGQGNRLKAQVVRGALGVGGLKLLSLPLTLATSILLARELGPAGYGQYAFVLAMISLLALPIGPGLGPLITREVAKYHHGDDWGLFRGLLRRTHQWVLAGSVLLFLALGSIAAYQAQWAVDDRWTLFLVAALLIPLLALNVVRSSTLRGLRYVFYAQLPDLLVRPGLHLVIATGLLLVGLLNPATALASQVIAAAGGFLLGSWLLIRRQPTQVSAAQPSYRHHEWGRALLPFTLLAAVGTFNAQIGILALGWLGSDDEVGALKVAMSGAMLVSLSLAIVNLVIAPHITRAYRDNDWERMRRLSRQSARVALAIALPIGVTLIVLGGPLVHLAFGDAYVESATLPLAILATGQLVNVAFGSVGMFLTMTGYERDTLLGQLVALMVTITAALILIPPLGATGAAMAVAIGLVTWNAVLAWRFVKRLGFRPSAF